MVNPLLKVSNSISNLIDINLRDHNFYHHTFSLHEKEDYIGYGVNFEKMRKIFIIRAPYVINNKTDIDYQMRIYMEDGETLLKVVELKSDQVYPIDHKDYNKKFSISSILTPDEWSNSIKFRTIIEKVPKNTTVMILDLILFNFRLICIMESSSVL